MIGCFTPEPDRPILDFFAGTTRVSTLWDSGSQISLVDHRIMSKICRENAQCVRRLTSPAEVHLSTANGKKLEVLALYKMKLTRKSKAIWGDFYVVKNLSVPAIIGCDLMAEHGVSIDMKQRKVKFSKKKRELSTIAAKAEPLYMSRNEVFEPYSENKISIKVPSPLVTAKELLFENPKEPININLVWPEAVVPVHDWPEGKYIQLIVVNLSKEHVRVAKGEEIGFIRDKFKSYNIDSIAQQVEIKGTKMKEYTYRDVNLEGLPPEFKSKYLKVINDNREAFSAEPLDIGNCPIMPHVIKLKDPNKVVSIPPYRMPYHLQDIAKTYVENLLKANVIRRSTSPFSSPLMLVRKANANPNKPISQQYRIVHNYKKVNENIERCAYPLRNLYELIDNVSKGKVYTVIDLSQGYFNQKCKDEQGATAFSLPSVGHFEYVKSPMGINSSPAFFQRLLDYITRGLKDVYVYMDDVIISSKSYEDNLLALEQTLKRFVKYKMKCNLSKTKFGTGRVEYLGYDISHTYGIRPGKLKTEAIEKFKAPESVTEIKQFLGLCSFFRRVVPRFSFLSAPLSALTRKNSGYTKGPLPSIAQRSFEALKAALVTRPCVAPVDFEKEFIVTVDTSQTACGAILSQKNDQNEEQPCAYFSSVLSECDSRKSAYHREQLGILQALRHFKPYLFGKHFILRTDHKPLAVAQTGKLDVLDRIGENINEFQPFTMEYMKGEIIPADYLSRPNDKTLQNCGAVETLQNCGAVDLDLTLCKNTQLSHEAIKTAQQNDKRIKALAIRLLYKTKPDSTLLRAFVNVWSPSCKIKKDLVVDKNDRILLPDSLILPVLHLFHDKMGHKSAKTVKSLVSNYYVWPEMDVQIDNYVQSCDTCGRVKPPHKYSLMPLQKFDDVQQFNERVHVDCLTNLPPTLNNNHTCALIIVDSYSGYTTAHSLRSPNASDVADIFINEWVAKFSAPKSLISDGGREFQNNTIAQLCSKLNINHIVTSPYHSRSNGLAERKVRQLVEFLRMSTDQQERQRQSWDEMLPEFTLITNITKSTRGFSPYFLVFNQEPNLPIENLLGFSSYDDSSLTQKLVRLGKISQLVIETQSENFAQNKKMHDKQAKELLLSVGSKVYVNIQKSARRKLDPKFSGPFLVIEDQTSHAILKAEGKRKLLKVHKDRIKLGTIRDQIFDTLTLLAHDELIDEVHRPLQSQPSEEPILEDDYPIGRMGQPGPAMAGAPDLDAGPGPGGQGEGGGPEAGNQEPPDVQFEVPEPQQPPEHDGGDQGPAEGAEGPGGPNLGDRDEANARHEPEGTNRAEAPPQAEANLPAPQPPDQDPDTERRLRQVVRPAAQRPAHPASARQQDQQPHPRAQQQPGARAGGAGPPGARAGSSGARPKERKPPSEPGKASSTTSSTKTRTQKPSSSQESLKSQSSGPLSPSERITRGLAKAFNVPIPEQPLVPRNIPERKAPTKSATASQQAGPKKGPGPQKKK